MLLGLMLYSYHLQNEGNSYENSTPGIYAAFDNDRARDNFGCVPVLGVYRNSINRNSGFAGCSFGGNFRVLVGAVSGYSDSVVPLVYPSYVFQTEGYGFSIGYVPRPPVKGSSSAIHFSIERQFK